MATITQLPGELLELIVCPLDFVQLSNLRMTCRKLYYPLAQASTLRFKDLERRYPRPKHHKDLAHSIKNVGDIVMLGPIFALPVVPKCNLEEYKLNALPCYTCNMLLPEDRFHPWDTTIGGKYPYNILREFHGVFEVRADAWAFKKKRFCIDCAVTKIFSGIKKQYLQQGGVGAGSGFLIHCSECQHWRWRYDAPSDCMRAEKLCPICWQRRLAIMTAAADASGNQWKS